MYLALPSGLVKQSKAPSCPSGGVEHHLGFGFDKLHQPLSTIAAHHDGRNVENQRHARFFDRNQHKDSSASSHPFLYRWCSYLQSSLFCDS